MQLQRYFDGSVKPISPHIDDIVETAEGERLRRGDALVDSEGNYHATEEDVEYAEEEYAEARAERVHEVVDNHCRWTEEYTEHEDYGDGYAYVAMEGFDVNEVTARLEEYIEKWAGNELKDDEVKALARKIAEEFDGIYLETEHYCSEYAAWHGDGVEVDSFAVGEVEGQIEVKEHAELNELTEAELEAALASYNGDAYLHKSHRKSGYVDRGTITYYANPGGRWHYYIPGDYIKEQVEEYLEACEE